MALGQTGPIPARSDQKVRRNKPDIEIEKVTAIGAVKIPELGIPRAHQLVVDIYDSLRISAQSRYYEPSDWQFARLTLHLVNKLLRAQRPSAQMVASINQMLSVLLMTEGDRRRVRMEIERNPEGGADVIQIADLYRQRLAQG
jgi:hypothetical protein